MCGIVYTVRKDGHPAQKVVLKRYKQQDHRGRAGYGYVAIDKNGKIKDYQRKAWEDEIKDKLKAEDAPGILFHHRMPTSTVNVPAAAHPFLIDDKRFKHKYYVEHNGVIRNDDEVGLKQEQAGYKFTSTVKTIYETSEGKVYGSSSINDSEVFAIELAEILEGKKAEFECRGTCAFICLEVDRKTNKVLATHFGRNYGNPLKFAENPHLYIISSESKDTNAVEIPPNVLHTIHADGTKSKRPLGIADALYAPAIKTIYPKSQPGGQLGLVPSYRLNKGHLEHGAPTEEVTHPNGGTIQHLGGNKPSDDDLDARANELGPELQADIAVTEVKLESIESALKEVRRKIDASGQHFGTVGEHLLEQESDLEHKKVEVEQELVELYAKIP